ncbi:hypothetical protein [Streptomyces sp. CB01881]|nr:hypothetical protein [Streptomyces sp. CB01881]
MKHRHTGTGNDGPRGRPETGGRELALADFRSKITILDFWAFS